jgi:elongation factor Ts
MAITASQVNELRQKTGAPLMDCKKALTESNGDLDAAIDYLRKKGQKVSALRNDRDAKEGVVYALTSQDGKTGVLLNLGCETDFVGKNAEFIEFARKAAGIALSQNIDNVNDLLRADMDGVTIGDRVSDMIGKIGEKIELKKLELVRGESVVPYIHAGYKMGVLVAFNQPKNEKIETTGKDVAMQIAAMNPVSLDKDSVPQEVIDRELDIAREQIRQEGKPENMLDKIAAGKLQKFFKDNTLLAQQFVKDGNKTVADVIKETDANLKVVSFKRMTLV